VNEQAWESPPRAWAEVDLGAMKQNFEIARELGGDAMMLVVKAGAYGHGLEMVARTMEGDGVEFFGVANVGEARRLQRAGIRTRIYLLGPTWSGERREIVEHEWTPCVSTLAEAQDFEALAAGAGKVLRVHLAVDTGMGRGGFLPEDLPGAMAALDRMAHLEIEGIGSHLPCADEDEDFTRQQIAQYGQVLERLGGVERFRWRHLLNSAGLMGYRSEVCNLCRPGLMLYGISPMPGYQERLRTVMTLKSRVSLVRDLPAGHGVSYGRQYVTDRPTRVATVGIGYGDGYPRHVSGQGAEVWLGGQRCPVLGRVTMDQIMVDVTGVEGISEGDEVELFGEHIPADEVAAKAGTIVWEVFTGITPRVVRIYHGAGQPNKADHGLQ
jgi:alanine racemase